MSNVKVYGNAYNGVTSVRLPLADDTGYATYKEGAESAKDWIDILMNYDNAATNLGDIVRDDIYSVNISMLDRRTCGTISFPNASAVKGTAAKVVADNLLFPKAEEITSQIADQYFSLENSKISGVVDLGTAYFNNAANMPFKNAVIGTLKLGNFNNCNGMFMNATITNLVWNHTSITADSMGGGQGLGSAPAGGITNAYVPDSLYDDIKALMDAGTLTAVTNLYKISEWSDE